MLEYCVNIPPCWLTLLKAKEVIKECVLKIPSDAVISSVGFGRADCHLAQ